LELLILLAALQLGDILTTLRFLKRGVGEANPVLRKLFQAIGVLPTLIGMKGALIYLAYSSMGSAYWTEVMIGLCVVYAYVCYHNYKAVKPNAAPSSP